MLLQQLDHRDPCCLHLLQVIDTALCRLFDVNPEGSVPVMKVIDGGKWVVGSGEIADYLEDQIAEPSMGKAEDQTKV